MRYVNGSGSSIDNMFGRTSSEVKEALTSPAGQAAVKIATEAEKQNMTEDELQRNDIDLSRSMDELASSMRGIDIEGKVKENVKLMQQKDEAYRDEAQYQARDLISASDLIDEAIRPITFEEKRATQLQREELEQSLHMVWAHMPWSD